MLLSAVPYIGKQLAHGQTLTKTGEQEDQWGSFFKIIPQHSLQR